MKFLIFLCFALVGISSYSQNAPYPLNNLDSLKARFLSSLPKGSLAWSYFVKVTFTGDKGSEIAAMISKSTITNYLESELKINNDSVEELFDSLVLVGIKFPIQDTSKIYTAVTFDPIQNKLVPELTRVRLDTLLMLKSLSLKNVLSKYFDAYGVLKRQYHYLYFDMCCYFFDNFVEADDDIGLRINRGTFDQLKKVLKWE